MEIPGYRIERLIAEGGMSSVYLAVQESLGRPVALKLLKKFDCPQQAERFLREAHIIASLQHQNVITIHDVGMSGERYFIAMEYLEGGSLLDRIRQGLQPELALDLLERIAASLDFVHRRGVVHRDLKPSNILFHADGTPKLTDFGIARQLHDDQELTLDGSTFGSPYYLSPEQAEGQAADVRSDIYALGIMFHQMLTNRLPYTGNSHIETIIAHLSQPMPLLPDTLSAYQPLLERMIAKQADDRIATAEGLVQEIHRTRLMARQRAVGTQRLASAVAGWLGRTARYARQAPMAVKLPVAGALLFVGAGTLLSQHPPRHDAGAVRSTGPAATAAIADARQAAADAPPKAASASASLQRGPSTPTHAAHPPATLPGASPAPPFALQTGAREPPPVTAAPPTETSETPPVVAAEVTGRQSEPRATERSVAETSDATQVDDAPEAGIAERKDAAPGRATAETEPVTPDAPLEDARQDMLTRMQAGDEALKALRLTTPPQDNAFAHYSTVLELDPQHPGARAGIDRIADQYCDLARNALDEQDERRAGLYLQRGLRVRSDHAGLIRIRQEIELRRQPDGEVLVRHDPIGASPEPPATPAHQGTGNIIKDLKNVWRSLVN